MLLRRGNHLKMAYRVSFLFLLLVCVSEITASESASVPAIFVFGDSLVDVGNNNYLKLSLAKANFPHNGVDFPTGKPTGRFCNGKNAADFLAEKVGLPASPPYLSLVSNNGRNKNTTSFSTGISFASGGAGIFNSTNNLFRQSVAMSQQIDFYSSVNEQLKQELGSSAAAHISKSIFAIVIGSNDMFHYFGSSDLRRKNTPQQYVDLMLSTLESQLKRLYGYGARKYVIGGVALVGCTPSQRKKNKNDTRECDEEVNHWAAQYNIGLKAMLQRLKMELNAFAYSYFDAFAVMSDYVRSPSSYGFVEIKAACCGLGNLNADIPCIPISSVCPNRTDHLFWDLYHPTQEVHRRFADYIFDGPLEYASPINVRKLITL